ncbi:MAG: sulfotransferase domain-containing protein [Rhodospirillales bacterium]|nr:sulfotransferase domain-containing protein [Rhodospirillales bacterium]
MLHHTLRSLWLWRDRQRRGRKLLRRVRSADVAVISLGKSGRTWLRTMISHLYHQRHGLPSETLLNFDNFHNLVPAIPRYFFGSLAADRLAPSGRTWAREVGNANKLILLVRDPRDVVVSFYFQLSERATSRALRRKGLESGDAVRQMPMAQFMLDDRLGLPRALAFVDAWLAVVAVHPASMIVCYEDLRRDPLSTFTAVAPLPRPRL